MAEVNVFSGFFLSTIGKLWFSVLFLLFLLSKRKRLEFKLQNADCFFRFIRLVFACVCLVFTFDWHRYGVVLCYSSRVDQIKLKHRTAYTTCSNPIKSSQCIYRQKIAKSILLFFLFLSCACLSTVRPSIR